MYLPVTLVMWTRPEFYFVPDKQEWDRFDDIQFHLPTFMYPLSLIPYPLPFFFNLFSFFFFLFSFSLFPAVS